MRLGLPRPVRPVSLQLVKGQVHQVPLLRSLLLPKQVRLPLTPNVRLGQVHPTGRRKLQLMEEAHQGKRKIDSCKIVMLSLLLRRHFVKHR